MQLFLVPVMYDRIGRNKLNELGLGCVYRQAMHTHANLLCQISRFYSDYSCLFIIMWM